MKKEPTDVLGIDYGGVICQRKTDEAGVYHPIEGVFEALVELAQRRFGKDIFVISHAEKPLQHNMMRWLVRNDFFRKAKVSSGHLEFCVGREMKAEICRRKRVTHFIDDRLEVMSYLVDGVVPNLYLFQPDPDEMAGREHLLPKVHRVDSWMEAKAHLLG